MSDESEKIWLGALVIWIGLAGAQNGEHACAEELWTPEAVEASPSTAGDATLVGVSRQSDHAFDDFISPMTNPVDFEDPRIVTEVRTIFINNHLPTDLGGKDAQAYAAQLRAALTEKPSLIATKDVNIVSQNPVVQDGFADVSAGLKYNLFKDYDAQQIVSAGFTYALPIGSTQALQGRTDGEFNVFLTGGTQVLDSFHFLSATGFRLPVDTPSGNQVWYWSNHFDWQVAGSRWYLFTEANWYHYMSGGDAFPVPVGGMDLFNPGSTGIGGSDIVTGAYGLKFEPNRSTEPGVAYEFPYTSRQDIMENRLTVDFIIWF